MSVSTLFYVTPKRPDKQVYPIETREVTDLWHKRRPVGGINY